MIEKNLELWKKWTSVGPRLGDLRDWDVLANAKRTDALRYAGVLGKRNSNDHYNNKENDSNTPSGIKEQVSDESQNPTKLKINPVPDGYDPIYKIEKRVINPRRFAGGSRNDRGSGRRGDSGSGLHPLMFRGRKNYDGRRLFDGEEEENKIGSNLCFSN